MTQVALTGHRICHRLMLAWAMLVLSFISNAAAQTTALSYQGKLNENGNPANGNYDFQFKLFDAATVGTGSQQGSTLNVPNVQVADGIFTAQLDFGAGIFNGAPRFLEIGIRPAGSPDPFTLLSPRQPVTSTPYAMRSATAASADTAATATNATTATNANQLGGIAAGGFIQNTTTTQTANYNINGDGIVGGNLSVGGAGSANILNATTQFNLGGNRILSNPGINNLFAGIGAGAANTGTNNSLFGINAGQSNTTGVSNAFFGAGAGIANTTGSNNSFFGQGTGFSNTTSFNNSFFGAGAGSGNTTGGDNSFFGQGAGQRNTTGRSNSLFGQGAGFSNTVGEGNSLFGYLAGFLNRASGNSFFGSAAGFVNTTGSGNSFFGFEAGNDNTTGCCNSFFGTSAGSFNTTGGGNSFFGNAAGFSNMTASGNSFFGSNAGPNNSTGGSNSFFGERAGRDNTTGLNNSFFGWQAGLRNTTANNNTFFGQAAGSNNNAGSGNTFIGKDADFTLTASTGNNNTLLGANTKVSSGVSNSTAIGAGASVTASNLIVLGTSTEIVVIPGNLNVFGSKNFKIDHPLDPENKYLYHAAVESSEVLNVYSGNVATDEKGDAQVTLPDWFEALNRDFRYQLTVIGTFAQAIVSSEIRNNRFHIKTNAPKVKVSWQVTGVRSDAGLLKHPFKVEEDKPENERGRYLSPEGFRRQSRH